jgi:rieske iron-sulfur protein
LSETADDQDQEEKAQSQASEDRADSSQKPKPASARPRIGTPIGTPSSANQVPSQPPAQTSATETRPISAPPIAQPGTRPRIGTPVGQAVSKPATSSPPTQSSARPSAGAPVASRPSVGTPAASARPSIGTPNVAVSGPSAGGRPVIPPKPALESKKEISRRRFLAALVIVGGALAIGGAGWFAPFIESSVGNVVANKQVLKNADGSNMKTSDVVNSNGPSGSITNDEAVNGGAWKTFTYPYTGNANVDSDTFKQCVIIRLPPTLTAPDLGFPYSVKDPLMSTYSLSGLGDTLVAFSRVCVHLWCLWSYNPTVSPVENEYTRRMQCPCHGSNYVPGTGNYSPPKYNPGFPAATNQPPGQAVAGPASLQVAPNNQLPIIQLSVASDGTLTATGIVGQIGCGQKC